MLPKSMRRSYVGCEDGPKAIKYYSAETRKVLISRNFRFLNLSDKEIPQAESSGNDDKAVAGAKRQRETTVS